MNLQTLRQRPYLTAIVAGALWNAAWAREDIKALATSAFVVGLCVGLLGSGRWKSLLAKIPAALGCFALVALGVDIAGRALGRHDANLYTVMNLVMTVYSSPLVVVGVLLGFLANRLMNRSAA